MPKKRNVKKILLIVIILFIAILAVREIIIKAIERANVEDKIYTQISDFTSIKEIAEYMGCTYIKEEKSTGEKYDIDIYLKFKYPLYTEGVSNEDYYYNMVALIIGYLNYQNIRLIDQENNVVIAVTCDKEAQQIEELLINGDTNYFGTQDTKKILENYTKFKTIPINPEAGELKKLIENEWKEEGINFGTQESVFDGRNIYFDEGIETEVMKDKVFHISFTENYKNNVVNGINVNTEEDTVIETLGTPDFTMKQLDFIGYRGEGLYVFFNFSFHQIDIYRTQSVTEEEEETIKQLLTQLSIDGNAINFASGMTDMWSDYNKFEYTDGYISLEYITRGVKFEVNITENNGLILYANYSGNLIKEMQNGEKLSNTYLESSDLIYEYETDYSIQEKEYKNWYYPFTDYEVRNRGIAKQSDKFAITDISEEGQYRKIRIISLDRTHYNFDFETMVTSYTWLDDYNFAYSISGIGIYRYNILEEETQTIIEGNETYELKAYDLGHLYYDDKDLIYIVE